MNILFLTIGRFTSIEANSIYADLLRCFRNFGHEIYAITPYEKRTGKKTELVHEKGAHVLHLETGNVTSASNLISKGLAQITLESTYIKAIKCHFPDVKFDLVLYSTPPITFSKAVEFIKKRDGAKSYLLLKDIFPQNAVDLGMISTKGFKGFIYKYFRAKEKKLYALSDYIGCMSEANLKYVLAHNPEIDSEKVEVCPNSVEVIDRGVDDDTKFKIRAKYGIPQNKIIFIYGGNLGKPQGISFLIECLKTQEKNEEAFFLIVGDGTEFGKLETYFQEAKPTNMKLMKRLPKEDYDKMVGACDVGMIFLDHRFTIPNFPSRLLAYMQARLPVLAVTDQNTDIGKVIVDGGFGWWCESNDCEKFIKEVRAALQSDFHTTREKEFQYLLDYFTVDKAYEKIMSHFLKENGV